MHSRHVLLAVPVLVLLYVLTLLTVAHLFSTSEPDEIFGLLHFVTSPDEADRVVTPPNTSDVPPVMPEKPIEMAWYALGSTTSGGWEERLRVLPPLVMFSKSYCPYSKRAKRLLEAYDLSHALKIVEVDLRADASDIKTLLIRLTHQSTFPNVILLGRSLGGSDDLVRLHEEDRLRQILEEGGIQVGWSGEDILF